MKEIGAMTGKAWIKNVTINNRNFKITFYRDEFSLLWYKIEEIYRKKKNFFDFTWKNAICCHCADEEETIIEQALARINKFLIEEEKTKNIEKTLDKYADYVV